MILREECIINTITGLTHKYILLEKHGAYYVQYGVDDLPPVKVKCNEDAKWLVGCNTSEFRYYIMEKILNA